MDLNRQPVTHMGTLYVSERAWQLFICNIDAVLEPSIERQKDDWKRLRTNVVLRRIGFSKKSIFEDIKTLKLWQVSGVFLRYNSEFEKRGSLPIWYK